MNINKIKPDKYGHFQCTDTTLWIDAAFCFVCQWNVGCSNGCVECAFPNLNSLEKD